MAPLGSSEKSGSGNVTRRQVVHRQDSRLRFKPFMLLANTRSPIKTPSFWSSDTSSTPRTMRARGCALVSSSIVVARSHVCSRRRSTHALAAPTHRGAICTVFSLASCSFDDSREGKRESRWSCNHSKDLRRRRCVSAVVEDTNEGNKHVENHEIAPVYVSRSA